MNQIIYSIIFTVSLLLGDGPEKHLFKKNTDLIITSDSETFSEMSFGTDYMMFTSSMRHNDEYYPVSDNKNYEQKIVPHRVFFYGGSDGSRIELIVQAV